MTTPEIRQSLAAVTTALTHFRDNLDRAGFGEGAATYKQMANVIVGQFFWSQEQGTLEDLIEFAPAIDLARDIHHHLEPYVTCMARLGALYELLPSEGEESDNDGSQLQRALRAAGRPMSASALSREVDDSLTTVRRELAELVESGAVVKAQSGSRVRYELSETS
jgi:DNA-binding transcriptional ArsR family regulator